MSEIREIPCLSGTISCDSNLVGSLSADSTLKGAMNVPRDYSIYNGPIEVIPNAHNAQVLYTEDKLLKQNVTVDKVPYWATSNDAGGQTAYIADKLQIEGE